jgi:hypothetical protein
LIGDLLAAMRYYNKIPDEGILMFFFEKQRIPSSGMTREGKPIHHSKHRG